MATPKHQRIIIWVITIVMAVGSLGAYFAIILGNNNGTVTQTDPDLQKQIEEYQKQQAACPTGEVADQKIEPAPVPPEAPVIADITELSTKDVTVGTGAEVKEGDCVVILFHGTLAKDGKAFTGGDNYTEGVPYRSLQSAFVPGFSQGLIGMKVGGERQVFIPSDQGYGSTAQGEIPADSDLIFSIKLVSIYTQ